MRTFLALAFCFVAVLVQAQNSQKIGYADWDYIFGQLPEYKQIDNELKTHGAQLENQLKAKYAEYEAQLKAFTDLPPTTAEAVRKSKQSDLQQMQESIEKFRQDAQNSIQKKQSDLMQPVFDKVSKAIESVAKENSFTFIINGQVSGGLDVLLYSDEKYNISDLVLKKLGITPPAKENQN